MANVFVGCPTYSNMLHVGTAQAIWGSGSRRHAVYSATNGKSLLSSNCNTLYAMCLNQLVELGLDWFAMIHADIEPAPWWIDTLIDEAEEHGADFISAVVAIKDTRGITSTAISDGTLPVFGRLTMRQIHTSKFPKTFDAAMAIAALDDLDIDASHCDRLLANTGCMLLRLATMHDKELAFRNEDGIRMMADGKYQPWDFSEDWLFTEDIHLKGGKVMCTTKLNVIHHGNARFGADKAWGSVQNDCEIRELIR